MLRDFIESVLPSGPKSLVFYVGGVLSTSKSSFEVLFEHLFSFPFLSFRTLSVNVVSGLRSVGSKLLFSLCNKKPFFPITSCSDIVRACKTRFTVVDLYDFYENLYIYIHPSLGKYPLIQRGSETSLSVTYVIPGLLKLIKLIFAMYFRRDSL